MTLRRSVPLVAGTLCLALALVGPAFAQTPAQSAYAGLGAQQLSQAQQHVSAASTSSLPFTGMDLGAIVLVAVVLAGTGFVLRRWSNSNAS